MEPFQTIIQNLLSDTMKELDKFGYNSDDFDIKVHLISKKHDLNLAGEIKEDDGKPFSAEGKH